MYTKQTKIWSNIFYFNNENSVKIFSKIDSNFSGEFIYELWESEYLICETSSNLKIIEGSERIEVVNSARASLDSTMAHFREFKYSFYWK